MAFPDGWAYYQVITLPAVKTLTDFPYLITNLPAHVYANARSDGGDIRFTNSDGSVLLPRHKQFYDSGGTSRFRALVPSLSASVGSDIRVYYGAPSETEPAEDDTYGKEAVWAAGGNDDYAGVWSLDEDPTGGAPQMIDGTANDFDGTCTNSPTQTTGQIGNCLSFSSNKYVDCGGGGTLDNSVFTYCAWIYTNVAHYGTIIGCKGSSVIGPNGIQFRTSEGSGNLQLLKAQAVLIGSSSGGISATTWYHVAVTYDGSGNYVFYIDGAASGSGTSAQSFTSTDMLIGACQNQYNAPQEAFNGYIDDASITPAVRSADWIYAEHYVGANQSAPSYGGAVAIGGGAVGPLIGGNLTRSHLIGGRLVA